MYKSIVNYLPKLGNGFAGRIAKWVSEGTKRYETIAYSLDDALTLVQNARGDSIIRVWNANYHTDGDLKRLHETWPNLLYFNMPGYGPYVQNVLGELPTRDIYRQRLLSDIQVLTIHHTVGWDHNKTTLENAKTIAGYHIAKGWPGIGYHFLLGPDGTILQTNTLESASYHAGSYSAPGDENSYSLGICLGGDFRSTSPSEAQISGASSLVFALRKWDLQNAIAVLPHKRMPGAATVCPGENIEPWLRKIEGIDSWI